MKKVLIVGVGSIGERHLKCMLQTGRVRAGICEVNVDLLKTVREKYEIAEVYESLDEALKSKWDAAVVASPANVHVLIAQKLAEKGIHLLIEKPLSTSAEGIEKLIQTVNDNKLYASVGYIYRAHPALSKLSGMIAGGQFGTPLQLTFYCGFPFAYYRPGYPKTYFNSHKTGGGGIQDALTHYFNLCEGFLGPISKLCVQAEHKRLEAVDVEDTVHVLAYHQKVMAVYILNMYQPAYEIITNVVCAEGQIKCEITSYDRALLKWSSTPESPWQTQEFKLRDRDEWFMMQENHFLDTLENIKKPLCSIEEAYQTLKVNLAALNSMKTLEWKTV